MSFVHVKIHYGPCSSFSTYVHRPSLIRGLRDSLRRHGYRVDMLPVPYVNYCVLEVCGHKVFQCNIKNLKFNMPPKWDPICQRAVDAVLEATRRLMRARIFLWTHWLLEDEIFKRSIYAPKNHWRVEADFTPMANICTDCCSIQLANEKKGESDTEIRSDFHLFPFD